MQLGHDDLGCRTSFFFVHIHRDAAAVVLDSHGIVGVDVHDDLIRVAGERFIDGVIDDFVHHVVESADVIGIADVHARALTDGVESFEDFDVFCCVVFCHQPTF